MQKKLLKLYGERNTGTNYLEKLISLNFNVKQLKGTVPRIPLLKKINKNEKLKNIYFDLFSTVNLGWKHTYIDESLLKKKLSSNHKIGIILLVKNPYSFLLSLHKKPYHNPLKKLLVFEDFIVSDWKTQKRENLDINKINPVQLWNTKMDNCIEIKKIFNEHVILIKYEQLVSNPADVINAISDQFGLIKPDKFKNYKRSTKSVYKDYKYYADYYTNEKWRNDLNEESIKKINKYLNFQICKKLGYSVIK